MKQRLNVGLIGFGMAGSVFHAPVLSCIEGFNLVKIRATKKAHVDLANQRFPNAQVVSNSNEIFSDPAIDLVVIGTPNTTHHSLAKEALLAGKHVVVDKPFTVNTEEADELIELAKKEGKVLSVHQNRRWDSNSKTVRKVIASGLLGKIVEYEAHYDRFRNAFGEETWKDADIPGAGILFNLGSHLIDEAQFLFGLPKEITGDVRIQRTGGKTTDNFDVVFHYENLKVILKGGMLVKEPGPTVMVLGDQGSFVKYGMDVQEEALKVGLTPLNTLNWGKEPEEIWGKINTEHKGLHIVGKIESEAGDYRQYYQNVYKSIIGDEQLMVTPEHARNTIRLIELAIQSSKEKRTLAVDSKSFRQSDKYS